MQFFSLFYEFSVTGKIAFILILFLISLWVYIDARGKGLHGWIWAGIIFIFPIVLPVYICIRPRNFIAFCNGCYRILPEDSEECFYCNETVKREEKISLSFSYFRDYLRKYFFRFLLEVLRTYQRALGFSLFLFKKKFLLLNLKYLYFYPWGRCHQLVATEGRHKGIVRKTLTYGETLYLTAWKVFVFAEIKENDIFYDLGSGTGNVVFFCNILYGIKSLGIDAIPTFIKISNRIKEELDFHNVTFLEGNFLDLDFSRGTVFYIVATVYDPLTRAALAEKFIDAPMGARVVIVTHKMDVPHLNLVKEAVSLFAWGYEKIYLYVRI